MKSEDWKRVKRGQLLILARTDIGVVKVTVIELDVAVEVTAPTYRREYPWGKTVQSGTVKIRYNNTQIIENLRNLIKYDVAVFAQLKKAYRDWQSYKILANYYREAFTTLISEETAK